MTKILNGNDEIVIFDNNKQFEVVEHFYNNVFMGYNLVLNNELIDTYDEEELAVAVMNELCRLIDENTKFIDIEKVNSLLEV